MSQASRRTGTGVQDRSERMRSRVAVVVTVLLHLLLVLLVMWSPPITMTTTESGDAGGSMDVTFIDDSLRPPPRAPKPVTRTTTPRKHVKPAPKARRIRTTLVVQSQDPVPPDMADSSDTPTPSPPTEPTPPSESASPPAGAPDATTAQPTRTWGQPPGMLPQATAPTNMGLARGTASNGSRGGASSGTSMEAEGYQVYYELIADARLRAWREQGMTELFMPLPGTRRLMVCPLEIVLRRGSGPCRMVEPDAPELKKIGDARDVVSMEQVYKLGELVWSGPGAYR
jgi:hypothetical protein